MMNLEDYFKTAVVMPEESVAPSLATESEQAFMEKYLGLDWQGALAGKGLSRPQTVESVGGFAPGAAQPDKPEEGEADEALEASLATAAQMQLVGFHVGAEQFAVPMEFVAEVIRTPKATKLPAAPAFLAGIVNLRGRVTPLIDLAWLFDLSGEGGEDKTGFVIVCRFRGLRLGLVVRAIAAMHRAAGTEADWNVEEQLGKSSAYVSGLLRSGDKLVRIVSVSRLFHTVMKA